MKLNIGLVWKEKKDRREQLQSWRAFDMTNSFSPGVPDTPVQCVNDLTK